MKDPGEYSGFACLPPPRSLTYTAVCGSFYREWVQYEQVVYKLYSQLVLKVKCLKLNHRLIIFSGQNAKLWVNSLEILQGTEGVYFGFL